MAKSRLGGRAAARLVGGGGGGAGGGRGPAPGWRRAMMRPAPAAQAQAQPTQTQQPGQDWWDTTDGQARILRAQMGQTGNEAGLTRRFQGDPRSTYIQTSKSYLVNNALQSDMKDITQGFVDTGAQSWLRQGYTMADAKATIKGMDAGMKAIPHDMKLVRYDGNATDGGQFAIGGFLKAVGVTASSLRNMSQAQLDKMFAGKTYDTKKYLSTSWRMDRTSSRDRAYMAKPVRTEYTVKAGTHAIITNNVGEHEIVLGRGYRQTCTGARWDNGQLVLSVTIDPGNRPGYYKIK